MIDIHRFLGKYVEITITRGIGTGKRKRIRRGKLTDIAGDMVCLQNLYDSKEKWIAKPVFSNDNIKLLKEEEKEHE
jgi:hypothetical protein